MAWQPNPANDIYSRPTNITLQLYAKRFPRKLKTRWSGPFKLIKVYPYGVFDLQDERTCKKFKVNGQKVKHYIGADMKSRNDRLKDLNQTLIKRQPNEGSDFKVFKHFNLIFCSLVIFLLCLSLCN